MPLVSGWGPSLGMRSSLMNSTNSKGVVRKQKDMESVTLSSLSYLAFTASRTSELGMNSRTPSVASVKELSP